MTGKYQRESKFWTWIHQRHLYENSVESLFKGAGFAITWFGSIFVYIIDDIAISQDAILFFAMSIILEYTVQFVSHKGTPKQLFPGILTVANFIVYCLAFIQVQREIANTVFLQIAYSFQLVVFFFSVLLVCVDTILKVCEHEPLDKRSKQKPENNLK